jgi:toxin-antitoxin system PIN domain toxin
VKLLDVNVWLALVLSGHESHEYARGWFLSEREEGGLLFCRTTQQSFLRLLTTAAVLSRFGNPALTNAEAWRAYQGFLADPRIAYAAEPADVERHWHRLAARESASPKVWMDAYLAAFAMAGGYTLVTIDTAFRQYDSLDVLLIE